MAKALLINPSYLRTYGTNQGGIANPVYPVLSLAALAGSVKSKGHSVRILDLSYRTYDPSLIRQTILEEKPDVVGITATTPLVNQMRDISFLTKEISKNILTVGGGAHASALPHETMQQSLLDMIVFGEGDVTFTEILAGKKPEEIAGIYWRKNGEIIGNAPRQLVERLDDLPMPAWELYPIEEYRNKISRIIVRNPPVSNIEFSRGCVFQCDFCGSKNTMGMGYRKKSPERCADEMEYLQKLGYREAILADDIFTSDHAWAIEVCEAIIRRKLKMAWTCTNGIRVDSARDELFRAMKRAGCYRVHFGFESGNDEVLKAFGKGGKATLIQGLTAVEKARSAGLETCGMYLVGLSSDTEQSMQDTIDYAHKTKVDMMRVGVTVPFPGTAMFRELQRAGRIKTYDWDQYSIYNEACAIFDHPRLSWETIKKFYHKAYERLYFKNPSYIFRRIWNGIKTGEFFWDLYYAVKFALLWNRKTQIPIQENYAFRERWEALPIRSEFGYENPVQKVKNVFRHSESQVA